MSEPSPFDPDAPPKRRRRRIGEPELPLTPEELDRMMTAPYVLRVVNPWLCAWNTMAEDGIGDYEGLGWHQCPVAVADPTKSRYCLEHARRLGVDFYSPAEASEATAKETSANLTRLVPKAVHVLETVMDDPDAPPGIRAKSAAEVLDRTGYARGVDVRVDASVNVIDLTAVINERLDALRDAKRAHPSTGGMITPIPAIPGEVVPDTEA